MFVKTMQRYEFFFVSTSTSFIFFLPDFVTFLQGVDNQDFVKS